MDYKKRFCVYESVKQSAIRKSDDILATFDEESDAIDYLWKVAGDCGYGDYEGEEFLDIGDSCLIICDAWECQDDCDFAEYEQKEWQLIEPTAQSWNRRIVFASDEIW